MICGKCNGKSYVDKTESFRNEPLDSSMIKRRRRVCRDCRKPFNTYELYSSDYMTLKRLLGQQSGLKRSNLKYKKEKNE